MIIVPDTGDEERNKKEQLMAREKEIQQYKIFSAQIELIGSLLKADQSNKILFEPLVEDLHLIVSYNKTDPLLLTAVCYLIYNCLECIDSFRSKKNKKEVAK